jgi:hypothetical protein
MIEPIPIGAMAALHTRELKLRVPGVLHERLQELAEQEQRTVANTVRVLLFEAINARAGGAA